LEAVTDSTTIMDVAMDASGNAFALMGQSGGAVGNGLVNRYTGAWSGATRMNTSNGGAIDFSLATTSSGDAFVSWAESPRVWSRRFTGGAWADPAMIATATNSAGSTRIGCDDSGRALAIWTDALGVAGSVMASELASPASRWTAAHPL